MILINKIKHLVNISALRSQRTFFYHWYMADLFAVTAPLLVHYPDNTFHLVADIFPHPNGIVYFEPYWYEKGPDTAHTITGMLQGEGPWKVGEIIIRLLSCGDNELSMHWNEWQQYLSGPQTETTPYHDDEAKKLFARKVGASV